MDNFGWLQPFLACGLSPQLQSNYVGPQLVISPASSLLPPPMEWLLCSSCLEDLSISELEAAVQKNLLACYGYRPNQG